MISVIIPTYNRKNMLEEVIRSIYSQTYKKVEIIIVDDCSSDGTSDVVASLKEELLPLHIKYFKNAENKGPGYNRSYGFKQAKGKYIVFMDDDDYYTDFEFYKNAIDVFGLEENIAMVSANSYKLFTASNEREATSVGEVGRVDGIEFLLGMGGKYKKPQSTFTTIFLRDALEKAEIDTMKMVNDYAIYMRALLEGDIWILPEEIGVYRLHDSNISNNIEKQFLLDNLDERIWIMKKLPHIVGKKRITMWWTKQMLILIKYYLLGTEPSFSDGVEVYMYMLKKSQKTIPLVCGLTALVVGYKVIIAIEKLKRKIKGLR